MEPKGAVAQLGERLVRIEKARGSIPLGSTFVKPRDIVHSMFRDFFVCGAVDVSGHRSPL